MAGTGYRWNIGQPCCVPQFVTTRKYDPSGVMLWRKDDGDAVYGVRLDSLGDLDVSSNTAMVQYNPAGTQQWRTAVSVQYGGFLTLDSADSLLSAAGYVGATGWITTGAVNSLQKHSDTGVFAFSAGTSAELFASGIDVLPSGEIVCVPCQQSGRLDYINSSGTLYQSLTQGGGPFVSTATHVYATDGAIIRKMDHAGAVVWEYDTGGSNVAFDVDSSGNVCGYALTSGSDATLFSLDSTTGTATWTTAIAGVSPSVTPGVAVDPGSGDIYLSSPFGTLQIWALQKYNSAGVHQWDYDYRDLLGNLISRGGVDVVFAGGNAYVAISAFRIPFGSYTESWVVCVDSGGAKVYEVEMGPFSIHAIDADSAGNIYVAGTDASFVLTVEKIISLTASLSTTYRWQQNVEYAALHVSSSDVVYSFALSGGTSKLVGYDTSGSVTDGPYDWYENAEGRKNTIGVDPSGNVIVARSSAATFRRATYHVRGSDGNSRRLEGFPTIDSRYWGQAITIDSAGDVYVAGSEAGFGLSSGQCFRKFSGGMLTLTGPVGPVGYCIAVDTSGNIYVAGKRTAGGITTLKIDPVGAILWSADHGGDVYAIAVDASGNVYTGGDLVSGVTTRKYDSAGTLLWSVNHKAAVYSVDVDASGNVYTGGVRTAYP